MTDTLGAERLTEIAELCRSEPRESLATYDYDTLTYVCETDEVLWMISEIKRLTDGQEWPAHEILLRHETLICSTEGHVLRLAKEAVENNKTVR